LVIALGKVLHEVARASDTIGALGDREFAVIAPSTDQDGARLLAQRVQRAFLEAPVDINNGTKWNRSLGAGYSAVENYAEVSIDALELVLQAATALRHIDAGAPERLQQPGALVRPFEQSEE